MTDGDGYMLPGGEIRNVYVCFDCHRVGEEAYLLAAARTEASEQGWASIPWSETHTGQRVFRLGHEMGRLVISGPFFVSRKYVLRNKTDFVEHGEVLIIGQGD